MAHPPTTTIWGGRFMRMTEAGHQRGHDRRRQARPTVESPLYELVNGVWLRPWPTFGDAELWSRLCHLPRRCLNRTRARLVQHATNRQHRDRVVRPAPGTARTLRWQLPRESDRAW